MTAADDLEVGPEARSAPSAGRQAQTSAAARCPHCRAALRPDAPWCTQCWTDLRAPEVPGPSVAAPAVPDGVGSGPGWPCTGCGTDNPVACDVCAACGTAFLAGLRSAEAPLLVLPVIGDLARLGRGQQYGLVGAAVLAVALLTLLLGLLTG